MNDYPKLEPYKSTIINTTNCFLLEIKLDKKNEDFFKKFLTFLNNNNIYGIIHGFQGGPYHLIEYFKIADKEKIMDFIEKNIKK